VGEIGLHGREATAGNIKCSIWKNYGDQFLVGKIMQPGLDVL
jgi:hypothetical protein